MEALEKIKETIAEAKKQKDEAAVTFKELGEKYNGDRSKRANDIEARKKQMQQELFAIGERLADLTNELAEASVNGKDTETIGETIDTFTKKKASVERQLQAVMTYKGNGSEDLALEVKEAYDNLLEAEKIYKDALREGDEQAAKILDEVKKEEESISAEYWWSLQAFDHTSGYGDDALLVKVYESQFGPIEVPKDFKHMSGIYKAQQVTGKDWR